MKTCVVCINAHSVPAVCVFLLQYCVDKAELHTEVWHQHSSASGEDPLKYYLEIKNPTIHNTQCETWTCWWNNFCLCFNEGPCWKQVNSSVWCFPVCLDQFKVKLIQFEFNNWLAYNPPIWQCHCLCYPEVSYEILQHHTQRKDARYLSHLTVLPKPSELSLDFHQFVIPSTICYWLYGKNISLCLKLDPVKIDPHTVKAAA